MIDPVRNRTYYRFTLISIPLLAAMLVFSTYADDEAQRRADVARRDRDMRRRVTDQAKLNEASLSPVSTAVLGVYLFSTSVVEG